LRDSLKTFLRAFREASGANPLAIARGLIQVTHTVRSLGFLHTATACTDRAIEISSRPEPAGEQSLRARFLNAGAQINAAISDRLRGDLAQAKVRLDTAMHLAEGIGDRGLIAYVHCGVASIERAAGNPARGISGLLGALEIYEEIGDRWGQAACLAIMCWAYADMLDTGAAARYAEQGRSVATGCNPRALASLVLAESVLARRTGDYATACDLGARSVRLFREAALDLYGAWAECELQASRFCSGQDLDSATWAAVPRRATDLTRATWLGMRALSAVSWSPAQSDGAARIAEAQAAARLVPASSPRIVTLTVLEGLVAAATACLASSDEFAAAVEAPLRLREAAPGVAADYRLLLNRLAATDLPGSEALRSLLGADAA
jgi:tetratricopeptide (TPR) repeat protein